MERKVRQRLRGILDYAIELGLLQGNPLPTIRRRRLERKHFSAVLDREGVGAILRAAAAAQVCDGVRRAHLIAAFTAQRIGEIVPAKWSEMDLESGIWTVPRERMKRKEAARGDHVVPLPLHLLADLKQWKDLDGDNAEYVCPAPRGEGFATREAVEKFYRRGLDLAGRHSPHSWRTVLSTWARDAGKDGDAVEAQLDHATGTITQTSYDRAKRLERRRELMHWHEEEMIAARNGAVVIPFSRGT
jgi:integrase